MNMVSRSPPAPQRVPTLTEVVQLAATPIPIDDDPHVAEEGLAPAGPAIDEAALAEQVLAEVQRHIDYVLEHRLRETLAPLLAKLSEALVREARVELASTLKDVAKRAVAQEVARRHLR